MIWAWAIRIWDHAPSWKELTFLFVLKRTQIYKTGDKDTQICLPIQNMFNIKVDASTWTQSPGRISVKGCLVILEDARCRKAKALVLQWLSNIQHGWCSWCGFRSASRSSGYVNLKFWNRVIGFPFCTVTCWWSCLCTWYAGTIFWVLYNSFQIKWYYCNGLEKLLLHQRLQKPGLQWSPAKGRSTSILLVRDLFSNGYHV